MAVIALAVIALWMILVGAARTYLHLRAGGGRPVRFSDRPGTPQWWARVIGTIAFALLVLVPIAELVGLAPIAMLNRPAVRLGGRLRCCCLPLPTAGQHDALSSPAR